MKKLIALLTLGAWIAAPALALEPDAIVGTWITEDKDGNRDSIVKIERSGDEFVGRVVWVKYEVYPEDDPKGMAGQPVVDRENPDPSLRGRPLKGVAVVTGLRFEDDGWTGGSIYAPREGATYRARIQMADEDTLEVRGYIGTPFLGRTVTWRRAEVPAAAAQ